MKPTFCSPAQIGFLILLATSGMPTASGQPANDLFDNRAVIVGTNFTTTVSSVGAGKEAGEPSHAGIPGGASVWWTWTAPSNETVTISLSGSGFDTILGVYTGDTVSALAQVASNDDEDYDGGIYTSKVVFEAVANQSYEIAADGYGGASGTVRLSLQMGPLPPPPPDPPAPAWVLPDPYGRTVYSSSYAGKVVIFDFWATWCGPCKAEIPDYVFLQNKYGKDGLAIIGPSVDSTTQAVTTFLTTNSPALNYQVVMANSAVQEAYGGIQYIPTTFLIDRNNLIRKRWVGTQSRATFEKAILPLLYSDVRLSCRMTGSQITLSWPATAAAFTLESSASLTSPAWSAWPTAPTVLNGTNYVNLPATSPSGSFRLRLQY